MTRGHVPRREAFKAAGLLDGPGLLRACALGPAGAVGLAEAVGGLSAVRGAGLLVPAAVAELEFPGTGSMGGMGFPSLLCSLKTWNRPRSPVRPSLGLPGLPEETGRTPRGCAGLGAYRGEGAAPTPAPSDTPRALQPHSF